MEVDGVRLRPDDGAHFGPEGASKIGGSVLEAVLDHWATVLREELRRSSGRSRRCAGRWGC